MANVYESHRYFRYTPNPNDSDDDEDTQFKLHDGNYKTVEVWDLSLIYMFVMQKNKTKLLIQQAI